VDNTRSGYSLVAVFYLLLALHWRPCQCQDEISKANAAKLWYWINYHQQRAPMDVHICVEARMPWMHLMIYGRVFICLVLKPICFALQVSWILWFVRWAKGSKTGCWLNSENRNRHNSSWINLMISVVFLGLSKYLGLVRLCLKN